MKETRCTEIHRIVCVMKENSAKLPQLILVHCTFLFRTLSGNEKSTHTGLTIVPFSVYSNIKRLIDDDDYSRHTKQFYSTGATMLAEGISHKASSRQTGRSTYIERDSNEYKRIKSDTLGRKCEQIYRISSLTVLGWWAEPNTVRPALLLTLDVESVEWDPGGKA